MGNAPLLERCGVDGRPQPVGKRRAGFPAEGVFGARRVELAARLAVRLRRIEVNLPPEAGCIGDQVCEIGDADLFAAAEIDRLRARVAFEGRYDAFGAVAHIQKLARRLPCAPDNYRLVAAIDRFDALA